MLPLLDQPLLVAIWAVLGIAVWDVFWPPALALLSDGAEEAQVEQAFAFAIQSMAWGRARSSAPSAAASWPRCRRRRGLVDDRGGLPAVAAAAQTSRLSTSASVSARRTTAASEPSTSTVAGRGRALKFAADTSS